jgi:MFS family permease
MIFGLVWLADAMQVLSIGFSAPSIAKTFGLTMPQALQTGTLFFVGMLIGAFVFGRLADRIGRRPVLMMAVVIDACFGVASAFAPDFTWLLALRFLTGIGVGATLPVDYTMMAEFLPSDRRGRWLVLLESFWALGTICLAVLALWAVQWGDDAWPWSAWFCGSIFPSRRCTCTAAASSRRRAQCWGGWPGPMAARSTSRRCSPSAARSRHCFRCSGTACAAAAFRCFSHGR